MFKGTYLLHLKLNKTQHIRIGRIGNIRFKKGFYVYVGSARNGIIQRVSRHLKDKKKLFWHIDYFIDNNQASVESVFYTEDKDISECDIARNLGKGNFKNSIFPVRDFGCSDCSCESHFFYLSEDLDINIFFV